MPRIDPGLNFFGNRVHADMTLEDFEQFLPVVRRARPRNQPNNRLQATANSLRSFLAPAISGA